MRIARGSGVATCLALLIAACSPVPPTPSPTPTPVREYGTVTGTLELAAVLMRPLSGTLNLHGPGDLVVTTTASSDGHFTVGVPIGSYTIRGRSPQYERGTLDCGEPAPFTVRPHQAVNVTVICEGF